MGEVVALRASVSGVYRLRTGGPGVAVDQGGRAPGDVISISNRSGAVVRRVVWDGFPHLPAREWVSALQSILHGQLSRSGASSAARKLHMQLWIFLGYGGSVVCDPIQIGLKAKIGKRYAVELAVSELRKLGILILAHRTEHGDAWRLNPGVECSRRVSRPNPMQITAREASA